MNTTGMGEERKLCPALKHSLQKKAFFLSIKATEKMRMSIA
jgi:hypothetical protein